MAGHPARGGLAADHGVPTADDRDNAPVTAPPRPSTSRSPGPPPSDGPSAAGLDRAAGAVSDRRAIALLAATLFLVSVVLLAPTRNCGLVGDDWEHLRLAQRHWRAVLTEPLSYHFIPLGGALHKVLLSLAGLDGTRWAAANAAMLFLAAMALFRLSARLFGESRSGFLSACLLLGSAAFHEVTFWPTVGVVFAFSGILFAFALELGFGLARPDPPAFLPYAFAFTAGAACLAYPGTVTAFPIALLWYAMTRPATPGGPLAKGLGLARGLASAFAPSAFVVVAIGATRWVYARELSAATRLSFDAERLKYLAEGIASIFSLQGSRSTLHRIATAGLASDGETALSRALTAVFVTLVVILLASVIRGRPGTGEAYLAMAFLVHLATLAPWIAVSPRHCFLPSMLGLPLAVRLLGRAVEAARVRRAFRGRGARTGALVLVTAVALLAARRPFQAAADLWARSARSYRDLGLLLGERRAAQPGLATLVTVDLPSFLTENGFTVPFASYNLPGFVSFSAGGLLVERFRLKPERGGLAWGEKVQPVSLRRIQEMVLDPARLVVRFDPRSGTLVRLSPEGFVPAGALTFDRAPELGWREGAWPWLLVSPSEELEVALSASRGDWVALRYLSEASSSFQLMIDRETVFRAVPSPGAPSAWRTIVRAIPGHVDRPAEDRADVRVEASVPVLLAGIWVFRPLERVTPASAPFLSWYGAAGDASFAVDDELLLPLRRRDGPGNGPAEIELDVVSSPLHSGSLEANGHVAALEATPEKAGWTKKSLAFSGESLVLRIRSDGAQPLRVRSIRLVP